MAFVYLCETDKFFKRHLHRIPSFIFADKNIVKTFIWTKTIAYTTCIGSLCSCKTAFGMVFSFCITLGTIPFVYHLVLFLLLTP
jgi:hypothetical protein